MLSRVPALFEFGGGAFALDPDTAQELVEGAIVDVQRAEDVGVGSDRSVHAGARSGVADVARVGSPSPSRAALRNAGSTWIRAARRSWNELGSTSYTHSGMPPGAATNWMLPAKRWPVPEYDRLARLTMRGQIRGRRSNMR